jgi:hypothetical protein
MKFSNLRFKRVQAVKVNKTTFVGMARPQFSSNWGGTHQSCQICLGATYQNGKNIPNKLKIDQMAIKCKKLPQNTYTK